MYTHDMKHHEPSWTPVSGCFVSLPCNFQPPNSLAFPKSSQDSFLLSWQWLAHGAPTSAVASGSSQRRKPKPVGLPEFPGSHIHVQKELLPEGPQPRLLLHVVKKLAIHVPVDVIGRPVLDQDRKITSMFGQKSAKMSDFVCLDKTDQKTQQWCGHIKSHQAEWLWCSCATCHTRQNSHSSASENFWELTGR